MTTRSPRTWLRRLAGAAAIGLATTCTVPALATDLGVEGQVFEAIEEDFRLILMRLLARHDWTPEQEELKASARDYTKNLPAYLLPRAEKTLTRWKDVGVVVTEDIYLPTVDWKTGSVFEPDRTLVAEAGAYFNPIAKLPSAGIERLFIFDATDPEQLALARELLTQNIPQLSFMLVAGDLGELAKEVMRPIYYPSPTMLEAFHVRAVPTMIGFGRGKHLGHMAITELHLPAPANIVQQAWFGLGDTGFEPNTEDKSTGAIPAPTELPIQ